MSGLKVLVVGGGGREHALGWALERSASVARVESAPGNPGLQELGATYPVAEDDLAGLQALVEREGYDLVVIGPEAPLALGLADLLRETGAAVFGPGAAAARLESSKSHAKAFMARHGIPTAAFRTVEDRAGAESVLREWGAPVVVKASGLAAGKGVFIAENEDEARAAFDACLVEGVFGEAGWTVVVEEMLTGEEASVFVVTDGTGYRLLPGSQDHKRAYDGDQGPNTGGMGAYSPAPVLTPEMLRRVEREFVDPTLDGLRAEGLAYRGVIYLGLMIGEDGPRLLEYNVRFGDPETQAVLPRVGADLGEMLLAAARGELAGNEIVPAAHGAAVCVVGAAADYPRAGAKGLPIEGIDAARETGALVFHAGTAREGETLVAAGGRVLGVVGTGRSLPDALEQAYAGLERIRFEGMRYRRDIGWRALERRTR